jgi:hypothetical protein
MSSTPTSPPPGNPNSPVPLILITADDIRGDPERFAALLNAEFQNLVQKINSLIGAAGTIHFNSHVDLQGNSIRNVAAPSGPNDVVTKIAADASYSAPALAPQLEATGASPLLTYRQLNNPNQRELSSTFLQAMGNTSPQANSSNIAFGAPSGGFVPVTISSGVQTRADGSTLPYAQFNDSASLPATFNINTISRTGNVVTGNTTGANTLQTGETVSVAGVGDTSYNGTFVLTFVGIGGSPPGPVFQYAQAGTNSSSSGGTISLFGVYYYVINPLIGKVYRVGPFAVDTAQNRLNAASDGISIIAVSTITGSGGNTTNSAAGATSPIENTGGGNRILNIS